MTSKEAIEKMKYRIDTAAEIAGRGEDGKAFEDMELAIEALENQEIILKILAEIECWCTCEEMCQDERGEKWCEEHCKYSYPQRECYLKYVEIRRQNDR